MQQNSEPLDGAHRERRVARSRTIVIRAILKSAWPVGAIDRRTYWLFYMVPVVALYFVPLWATVLLAGWVATVGHVKRLNDLRLPGAVLVVAFWAVCGVWFLLHIPDVQ